MSNDDWDAVEAAAKRAGWKRSGPLLQGPCPVTDEEYCTVEPASANPENSWRVPIPVQTQEPPCGTSAVLTTTCATTEALA